MLLICDGCSNANHNINPNQTVTVSLITDEHSWSSTDIVDTFKGDSCSFKLFFDEGYMFKEATQGLFDASRSTLKIKNVQHSTTVYVTSTISTSQYTINIACDSGEGTIGINPRKQRYDYGEEVQISVTEKTDKFISWSYNYPTHNYSTNPYVKVAIPFSFDKETTIKITDNTVIYANFQKSGNYLVNYYSNDEVDKMITSDFYMPEYQSSVNSIQGHHYFSRDGYLLESWNTKRDGSGTRIGLGSYIPRNLFISNQATLYAAWVKETDIDCFEFEENDAGELSIVGYDESNNATDVLVLPRKYDEKEITVIKANSIITEKEEVFISDTIDLIESNGITAENALRFHLFSSTHIETTSSISCDNVTKMYVNSAAYTQNYTACCRNAPRKYDYIKYSLLSKPLLLFVCHSTLYQNHDMVPMQSAYPNYNVYKFGAVHGLPGVVMMELVSSLTDSNDMVIYQFHEAATANLGTTYDFVNYFSTNFDLFLDINFSKYSNGFWTSWASFQDLYSFSFKESYFTFETSIYGLDQYGNVIEMNTDDYNVDENNRGPNNLTVNQDYLKPHYFDFFKDAIDAMNTRVAIVWSSYNKNAIVDFDPFYSLESRIKQEFDNVLFFDTMSNNICNGELFRYKDNFHLNITGGSIRVDRWINQLSSYL